MKSVKSLEKKSNCVSVACILKRGDQYLFCQREDNGLWELPGGAVEKGEESVSTALRELLEETGLKATKAKFRGIWHFNLITGKRTIGIYQIEGKVLGRLRTSWETPQVIFADPNHGKIPIPKYILNLLKTLEGNHHLIELEAGPFQFYVAVRYIYGIIKRKLRKLK